jgi:rod shape-determining protein MreD
MRLLIYLILAYVMVGLQIGLAPFLRLHGAEPNFVLMAAVFIAINAPREPAMLACFVLGIVQDFVTAPSSRLGLYGLSYGFFALFAAGSATVVVRGHPIVHFAVTLLGGAITALIVALNARFTSPGQSWKVLGVMMLSAVYSAIVAPVVIGILHRIRRRFQFDPIRRHARL